MTRRLSRSKKYMYCAVFVALILQMLPYVGEASPEGPESHIEREIYELLKENKRIADTPEREYAKPEKPTVYLTFDDGPSKLTPLVLDILLEEKIQATFFVLGVNAVKHTDMLKRIAAEGHSIGNHTYDHDYNDLYSSYSVFWDQLKQTERIIVHSTGRKPTLIRAPGGTYRNFDAHYYYYLEKAGYTTIDWNADSGDSRRVGVPASEIIANAKKTPLHHEIVLLMHDSAGHEETVEALPGIIRFYKDNGYVFAPLTDSVKPVQSRLGSPKWQRETSFVDHMSHMEQATISRVELDRETMELKTVTESSYVDHSMDQVPLMVYTADKQVVFHEDEYTFRDDRFHVSLRKLVEELGGTVHWDAEERVAQIRYGHIRAEYSPYRHTIKVRALGQPEQIYHMAEMDISSGQLIVPLRNTLRLLGNDVSDYQIGEKVREVSITARDGVTLSLYNGFFRGQLITA